jgi:hypothetical protein
VTAPDREVRALQAASEYVYRQLEADAQTAAFISQIRTLKAGIAAAPPTKACGKSSSTTSTAQAVPEGTYTTIGTRQDALRLGADDPCALKSDGAHLRLELQDGHFTQWESCKNMPDSIGTQGTYTSTDKQLIMHETCCGDTTLDWSFDGKALTLKIPQGESAVDPMERFIAEHHWIKVS